MVYLSDLVDDVPDGALKSELTERMDIVQHKIKFMDLVPVAGLFTDNTINMAFNELLTAAGATLTLDPGLAAYVIYHEAGSDLNALMGAVPAVLEMEWGAVKNNRVILLNSDAYDLKDAESVVGLIEDLAEMLHPGAFIFGNEGNKWIRFGV